MTEDAEAIDFADDLAVLVRTSDRKELEHRSIESLRRINSWMNIHQLELAPEKINSKNHLGSC